MMTAQVSAEVLPPYTWEQRILVVYYRNFIVNTKVA
nr:MAG TPA: hypothetical protein [Caudoviricetes sp.]